MYDAGQCHTVKIQKNLTFTLQNGTINIHKRSKEVLMKKQSIDIKRTARLARLDLCEDEALHMSKELSRFADFARILSLADKPDMQNAPLITEGKMRSDLPDENPRDTYDLINNVRVTDGYIRVPLTVEEE